MKLGMQISLGPGHIVLDGDAAAPTERGTAAPQFRNLRAQANVYCGQMAGLIKMPFDMEMGLGPGHILLDGDPALTPLKRGHSSPQFWAHVCCDQTDGWIKMPLGRQIGLGLGDIVLDPHPAPPPRKGHSSPIFGPCLLWPNGRPSQPLLSTCLTWL